MVVTPSLAEIKTAVDTQKTTNDLTNKFFTTSENVNTTYSEIIKKKLNEIAEIKKIY